jgi:hypothetical protein
LDAKNGVVIPGSNKTDVISGITLGSDGKSANDNFGEVHKCCPPPCNPPKCNPPTCESNPCDPFNKCGTTNNGC